MTYSPNVTDAPKTAETTPAVSGNDRTPSAAKDIVLPASLPSGFQSSEFVLALVVLAVVLGALLAGKIDQDLAAALIGVVVAGYPSLRTWLKAAHLDAITAVLAARGGLGVVGNAAGVVVRATDGDGNDGSVGRSALGGAAALLLLGCSLMLLSGCSNAPYYVSGAELPLPKDGEFEPWLVNAFLAVSLMAAVFWCWNQGREAIGRKPPLDEAIDELREHVENDLVTREQLDERLDGFSSEMERKFEKALHEEFKTLNAERSRSTGHLHEKIEATASGLRAEINELRGDLADIPMKVVELLRAGKGGRA